MLPLTNIDPRLCDRGRIGFMLTSEGEMVDEATQRLFDLPIASAVQQQEFDRTPQDCLSGSFDKGAAP